MKGGGGHDLGSDLDSEDPRSRVDQSVDKSLSGFDQWCFCFHFADSVSGSLPSNMLGRSLLPSLSLLTLALCHSWYDCIPGITGSIGGDKNIIWKKIKQLFFVFTRIKFKIKNRNLTMISPGLCTFYNVHFINQHSSIETVYMENHIETQWTNLSIWQRKCHLASDDTLV